MSASMEWFAGSYRGKRVLVTGATGFKGSWLSLWLHRLGAHVFGYSTPATTTPSLYEVAEIGNLIDHVDGDIRDIQRLRELLKSSQPEIIFHLAAQPLVRHSYQEPLETLSINVLGTATLFEALRLSETQAAVVVVTSDKCYENQGWSYGYRETDPLGGYDPYSMSKACAELVTSSWQRSFFAGTATNVATARAGNVIGGGDWSRDRIVTDCIESLRAQRPIAVRSPHAQRPWQHVLEALSGYLLLGSKLLATDGARYLGGWNFGPDADGIRPVRDLVEELIGAWGSGRWEDCSQPGQPHEASLLALCCDKARRQLHWQPIWGFTEAVAATASWYRAWDEKKPLREITETQIARYSEAARNRGVPWATPHTS